MPRCEECNREFATEESLDQHNRDKHATQSIDRHELKQQKKQQKLAAQAEENRKLKTGKRIKAIAMIGGVSFVLAVVVYAALFVLPQQPSGEHTIAAGTGAVGSEGFIPNYPIHWHPHLRIVINGEEQIIPANIGITGSRHEPIHTHEIDGIIHVENTNPTPENMRLAYFFRIWGKKFSKDCIFEFCNSEEGTVKFYVNGKESDLFENYIYRDGDELLIEYGPSTATAE